MSFIRGWVGELRGGDGSAPRTAHTHFHRMLHPGIGPTAGNGLIAAQPLQRYDPAGEDPQSLSLLHLFTLSESNLAFTPERATALGSLLTFASGRRCQVLAEVGAKVEASGKHLLLPLNGRLDPELSSPMPDWSTVDQKLRDILARLTSAEPEDAQAIYAAMHLHYSSALLLYKDPPGAFALAVGGIETLAQRFGPRFATWDQWDRAASWDKWIATAALPREQADELRRRLLAEVHIKVGETFATYVISRLPDDFWAEEVPIYVWSFDSSDEGTWSSSEGTWSDAVPRSRGFADEQTLRRALKTAYASRSRYLHAGAVASTFVDNMFAADPRPTDEAPLLSYWQLRAALQRLIDLEVSSHGDPAPLGLEGSIYQLGPDEGVGAH